MNSYVCFDKARKSQHSESGYWNMGRTLLFADKECEDSEICV